MPNRRRKSIILQIDKELGLRKKEHIKEALGQHMLSKQRGTDSLNSGTLLMG